MQCQELDSESVCSVKPGKCEAGTSSGVRNPCEFNSLFPIFVDHLKKKLCSDSLRTYSNEDNMTEL